ncbi:MAG: hypothetical protein ACK4Q5_05440 [Saprospiraceae bacterium]
MDINFKYFTVDGGSFVGGISAALALVAREKVIIDATYLPVIEAAENGDVFALFEMQEAFAYGAPGVPKHYELARTYTDRIKDWTKGDVKPEVEALKNSALLELEIGNTPAAKKELVKATTLTISKLQPEEWDFTIFDYLREIVSATSQENQPE